MIDRMITVKPVYPLLRWEGLTGYITEELGNGWYLAIFDYEDNYDEVAVRLDEVEFV